jgi:hypothetical protein
LTKLASSAQPSSSSSFFQIKRSRRIMRTADDGDKLLQHRCYVAPGVARAKTGRSYRMHARRYQCRATCSTCSCVCSHILSYYSPTDRYRSTHTCMRLTLLRRSDDGTSSKGILSQISPLALSIFSFLLWFTLLIHALKKKVKWD